MLHQTPMTAKRDGSTQPCSRRKEGLHFHRAQALWDTWAESNHSPSACAFSLQTAAAQETCCCQPFYPHQCNTDPSQRPTSSHASLVLYCSTHHGVGICGKRVIFFFYLSFTCCCCCCCCCQCSPVWTGTKKKTHQGEHGSHKSVHASCTGLKLNSYFLTTFTKIFYEL